VNSDMKGTLIIITIAVCLTIIFVVAAFTMPDASKLFWTIVVGLAFFATPKPECGSLLGTLSIGSRRP